MGPAAANPFAMGPLAPWGWPPQVMDQWRRLIRRAPGTAVAAKEKARWAASGLGRPATAAAITARMRALIELLFGVLVVWVVSSSAGKALASSISIASVSRERRQ